MGPTPLVNPLEGEVWHPGRRHVKKRVPRARGSSTRAGRRQVGYVLEVDAETDDLSTATSRRRCRDGGRLRHRLRRRRVERPCCSRYPARGRARAHHPGHRPPLSRDGQGHHRGEPPAGRAPPQGRRDAHHPRGLTPPSQTRCTGRPQGPRRRPDPSRTRCGPRPPASSTPRASRRTRTSSSVSRAGAATSPRRRSRAFERMMRSARGLTHPPDPRLVALVGQVSNHFGSRKLEIISGFRPYSPTQYTAALEPQHRARARLPRRRRAQRGLAGLLQDAAQRRRRLLPEQHVRSPRRARHVGELDRLLEARGAAALQRPGVDADEGTSDVSEDAVTPGDTPRRARPPGTAPAPAPPLAGPWAAQRSRPDPPACGARPPAVPRVTSGRNGTTSPCPSPAPGRPHDPAGHAARARAFGQRRRGIRCTLRPVRGAFTRGGAAPSHGRGHGHASRRRASRAARRGRAARHPGELRRHPMRRGWRATRWQSRGCTKPGATRSATMGMSAKRA